MKKNPKMKKFIIINNTIFACVFSLSAIAELIGFLLGKGTHCGWASLFMALLSAIIIFDLKKAIKSPEKQNEWN